MDNELRQKIEETRAKHEYLTFIFMKDDDWKCGVVQNETARFIALYDLSKIRNEDAMRRFLAMADDWWWNSNRRLPIQSYIGPQFDEFQNALINIPKKGLDCDPIGPVFSLSELYIKRIKKRRVDLVNRKNRTR